MKWDDSRPSVFKMPSPSPSVAAINFIITTTTTITTFDFVSAQHGVAQPRNNRLE
jgi:hypothetical protein